MEFILLLLGIGALAGLFGGTGDDGENVSSANSDGERVDLRGETGGNVTTGNDNDTVFGSQGQDVINTAGGEDVVFGGGGSDDIYSGWGADIVVGGAGHDTIKMGGGDDIYGPSHVTSDTLEPTSVSDNWTGGHDTVDGGWGNDIIWDDRGRDVLFGGQGDDLLVAIEAPLSDRSDDELFGGSGSDVLVGDNGDQLTGGAGLDIFYMDVTSQSSSSVVITDFDAADETVVVDVEAALVDTASVGLELAERNGDTLISFNAVEVAVINNAVNIDPDQISMRVV